MVQRLQDPQGKIELGYWAIRGLGQPIRFMLAYKEVPFSEVRLGARPDGTLLDKDEEARDWEEHKKAIDFPFPNLPYLIDRSGPEEVRLTQSNAILRYLGRRLGLYGDNEQEKVEIDVLLDEAYDYRNWIVDTCYVNADDYPGAYAEFTATAIPRYLDRFERYLQDHGRSTHFVGDRISLVDFVLYELLWQTTMMVPGSINEENRPTLLAFIQAMESSPQIADYLTSPDYIERPINSHWAAFS